MARRSMSLWSENMVAAKGLKIAHDASARHVDTTGCAVPKAAGAYPKQRPSSDLPLETDVQTSVLRLLAIHPKVAWRFRMNTGGAWFKGQFVKFGFTGMADITGQLRDGRRLEIEVKRPGEHPTDDQKRFIDAVNGAGGVAFVARSVADVMDALDALDRVPQAP